MDRRQAVGGVLGTLQGWLGLNGVARGAPLRLDPLKGFVVYTENVGWLQQGKVGRFSGRMMEHLKKQRDAEFPGWGVVIVPVRPPQESKVEIHALQAGRSEIDHIKPVVSDMYKPPMIEDTPQLREDTREYVRLMLGAPVLTVELTDEQIDMAFSTAYKNMQDAYYGNKAYAHDVGYLKDGGLALCKMILGRIRRQVAWDDNYAEDLFQEGQERYTHWREELES